MGLLRVPFLKNVKSNDSDRPDLWRGIDRAELAALLWFEHNKGSTLRKRRSKQAIRPQAVDKVGETIQPWAKKHVPLIPKWRIFIYGLDCSSLILDASMFALQVCHLSLAAFSLHTLIPMVVGAVALAAIASCVLMAVVFTYNRYVSARKDKKELARVITRQQGLETYICDEKNETVDHVCLDDLWQKSRKKTRRNPAKLSRELFDTSLFFAMLACTHVMIVLTIIPLIPALVSIAGNPLVLMGALAIVTGLAALYWWKAHGYYHNKATLSLFIKTLNDDVIDVLMERVVEKNDVPVVSDGKASFFLQKTPRIDAKMSDDNESGLSDSGDEIARESYSVAKCSNESTEFAPLSVTVI